jgi:O-antigen ligase
MRWVAFLAALAAATALLFTGMRALWPFLLIGPAIPLIVLRPALNWSVVRRGILIAILPLLLIGYMTYDMIATRMEALVEDVERTQVGQDDGSLGKRLVIWKHGLEKAEENPIIGSGPGSIKEDSSEVFGVSHYHNFLLNALVKSGVPGVLAILGLFIVPLVVVARRLRPADGTGLAGLSLLLTLQITFLLSGSVGIMLGHDIHDALFIYGTIVACFLVAGKQTLPIRPTIS